MKAVKIKVFVLVNIRLVNWYLLYLILPENQNTLLNSDGRNLKEDDVVFV